MNKYICSKCAKKIAHEKCKCCGKDIKGKAGLLNLYVQSPTQQYANGNGRYWREWTKTRLCQTCYKRTVKKLKEIFFIASTS